MHTESLFLSSTLIGLGFIVALILGLIWLKKKNPEFTIGEIINHILLREKISFFVLGTVFINFAEAIFAASINPPGEMSINPTARFITHAVIAVISIVLFLSAIASISRIRKIEGPKFSAILTSIVWFIGAITLPYFNLILIASGLKELNNLGYALQGNIIEGMAHMSYAMNASLVLTGSHFILMAMDAASVLQGDHKIDLMALTGMGVKTKAHNKGEGTSDIDKKVTKKGEEEKKKKENTPENMITWLINAYRINNAKHRQEKIDDAIKKKDSLGDKERAKLSAGLYDLKQEVLALQDDKIKAEDNKLSEEDKSFNAEINTKIYNKIRNFWKGSHSKGEGFGTELPRKENSGN